MSENFEYTEYTYEVFEKEKAYIQNEVQRLSKIINEHSHFESEYNEADNKVVEKVYGYGGQSMHAGYFCPSIIEDIVIGNAKRGRISKKTPVKTPSYVYGFDANGKLCTFLNNHEKVTTSKTFVVRDGKTEIHISFGTGAYAFAQAEVGECIYDENNRILEYTRAHSAFPEALNLSMFAFGFGGMDPIYLPNLEDIFKEGKFSFNGLYKEVYRYLDDKMIVDVYIWDTTLTNHIAYYFAVEDDFLKKYTVFDYFRNLRRVKSGMAPIYNTYTVDIKRNIYK